MKRLLSILLAASLCFAACQNIEQLVLEVADDVLSAQIEQDEVTKTVLGESNKILWSENDQIVAFMKTSYGHKYQIQPSFAGKTYADFSKVSSANGDDISAGMEWDHIVAYYPYAEEISCAKADDSYTLDVELPAEQTYAENSFGNATFPMVAVSDDNDITFKNVCGGIKLLLKGTQKITSITIQGKNNEILSGSATVTAYNYGTPDITMTGTDAASQSVTLNCGTEGIQLNENTATEFIISLPPVVFTEGFTINMTDSESNTYTVGTNEENSVLRSSLLVMPVVNVGGSEEFENVTFSITISRNITKSSSYAEHADVVYYEVWDSDWTRKIYPSSESGLAKEIVVDGRATVNFALGSGKRYNIIFWAQNEECGAYNVSDLKRVGIDYSVISASENQDKFDAFYATKEFTVYGTMEETINLERPLAQLNFRDRVYNAEYPLITGISFTISNLATVFNTIEGCGEIATETPVTFVVDGQDLPANGGYGRTYMSNYVFAPGSSSEVDVEACFEIEGREEPFRLKYEYLPLGKNSLTNLLITWKTSEVLISATVSSIDDAVEEII